MVSPLEGIRVLDLSRLLPGPYLTMILGDMGADVVKVEAPGIGDYMRQMPPAQKDLGGRYLAVNRNKRSLVLNLKSPAGVDALLRMVETADVVVETFRPGVLDRLGIGFESLRERNRKIVLCSVSGYGQTGPYRQRAGHDLNYIGLAGVLAMSAEARGRKPAMPGVQIADLAGGALWGVTGVLGALLGRDRTGEGTHLDISMCEGSLALLSAEFGNHHAATLSSKDKVGPSKDKVDPTTAPATLSSKDKVGDTVGPTRCAEALNGELAMYSVYRTKDDKYLSVGALEPKFWLAFNQAIGRKSEMSDVIAPPERQEEIRAELQAILVTKTRDEWTQVLSEFDCCCEPILEMAELPDHPLHREREVFFTIEDDELGSILQVRTPVGSPTAVRRAPRLGEHSSDVLAEYGFSVEEITALTS